MAGPSYIPYRDIGSIPGLRLLFTPEALLWYNSNRTPAQERKQFLQKIQHVFQDIRGFGRPKRGRLKSARSCEVPVLYLRLTKDQRVFFDYQAPAPDSKDPVLISILGVSDKSNFQARLASSAEHKVHASTFDQLRWDESDGSNELDLELATDEEFQNFQRNIEREFKALSESDRADGWSKDVYHNRVTRATIYDFRLPHIDLAKYNFKEGIPEILKLQPVQEEMLRENRDVFLLEGVAGTGKTTILLYRLVQYARALFDRGEFDASRFLFVTHNERLRDEVQNLLRFFFQGEELADIRSSILSVEETLQARLGDRSEEFDPGRRLTRDHFRGLLKTSGVDTDLFWEEYRGILRGYNLRSPTDMVSKRDYLDEIGRRRGRIDTSERQGFYDLAVKFRDRLENHPTFAPKHGGWDDLDICRAMMDEINGNKDFRTLDFLLIDEVQDLTTAEVMVFLNLLDPNGFLNISMAGDLSQSVQPSAFTWHSLRQTIFDVLQFKVSDEYRLDENFRSTPYLVHAANGVLTQLSEFNNETLTSIQRPFAGENSGEPLLMFFGGEDALMNSLVENNLPNDNCVLLVRDDVTKAMVERILPDKNAAFVETIAKFKGLEQENILLWDPASGSDRILDLLHHPVRGKKAYSEKSNISTGVIELKHLFVGFTRARYLMGVLLPGGKDEQHYFREKFAGKEYTNTTSLERINLFSTLNVDPEVQLERAGKFLQAGQYRMAAQVFQNLGEFAAYHFFMGKWHNEHERYAQAVNAYSASIDEGDAHKIEAKQAIARVAAYAIEAAESEDDKEETETKVRLYAGELLGPVALARLNAESELRRGNIELAVEFFIEAGEKERAAPLLTKIDDRLHRAVLYMHAGDYESAENSFRSHLESTLPTSALLLALKGGSDDLSSPLFPVQLQPIRNRFSAFDFRWAKRVARTLSGSEKSTWLRRISTAEEDQFLLIKSANFTDARNKFDVRMKRRQFAEARALLDSEEQLKQQAPLLSFLISSKQCNHGELLDVLAEKLSPDAEGESVTGLDDLLDVLGQHWLKQRRALTYQELKDLSRRKVPTKRYKLLIDDHSASQDTSQRLISMCLLADYMVLIENQDIESLNQFFETCRKMAGRTDQPIVAGSASMLCLHLADTDHPQHPGLSKAQISAAVGLFHLRGRLKFDKWPVFDLVLTHSLARRYQSTPDLDHLGIGIGELINRLSHRDCELLMNYALQHTKGRLNGSFYRLPSALRGKFPAHDLPYLAQDAVAETKYRRQIGKPLPKLTEIEILPVYTEANRLVRFVKKEIRWFGKLISEDQDAAMVWNSAIVDHVDEGAASDYGAYSEVSGDDEQDSQNGQDEHKPVQPGQDADQDDENDFDVDGEEEQVPETEDETIGVDVDVDDKEDLDSLLAGVEITTIEAPSIARGSILEAGLYDEVCKRDASPNGEAHIDILFSMFEERLPQSPKERSDALYAALNDVYIHPWKEFFQLAVILAIRRFTVVEIDPQGKEIHLVYDTPQTTKTIKQFALKNRGIIAQSGMVYAQSVFNLT